MFTRIQDFKQTWAALTKNDICPSVAWSNQSATERLASSKVASNLHLKRESVSFYQVVDLLSEGEIAGVCDQNGDVVFLSNDQNKNSDFFKGVYFNDSPVKNTASDTFNFRRSFAEIRLGSEEQISFSDLNKGLSFLKACQTFNYAAPLFSNNHDVSLPAVNINGATIGCVHQNSDKHDSGYFYDTAIATTNRPNFLYSEFPFVHTIINNNVDELTINMSFTGQYQATSGNVYGASVSFVIECGYTGDNVSLSQGGSVGYIFASISGLATSEYVRSYHVPLPLADKNRHRFVKITRVDKNFSPAFTRGNKSLGVSSIVENINEKLRYPNSSLMGLIFDGSSFGQLPKRSYDLKLLKINVPSNYDAEAKVYSGNWNGQFAVNKQWTDNPAWILYDIITNDRYGLGKYAFQKALVDKWNLYSISKYCDELVPTGNSGKDPSISFTVNAGGETFLIQKTSTLNSGYLSGLFSIGDEICFLDLKDINGNVVNFNYRGIIKDIKDYDGYFRIQIIKDFGVDNIFYDYPALMKEYMYNRNDNNQSAKRWLIEKIIFKNADIILGSDSATTFYNRYRQSYKLNSSVTQGKIAKQYEDSLPILEPRFACNIVFTSRDEALNVINNISSVFRGITYWSEGFIFPSIDKIKDPILMFNNSNVSGGSFSYTGSAKTARTSSVLVRYNDATDNFKVKVEYAEDYAALRNFGYNEQEVVSLGVTSRSQAKRIAKWILFTNQTETDVVQFATGQEASFLLPGDVISIQDNFKTTKRYGGRISDISYRDKTITLDKGVSENIVGQKIYFMVPKGTKSSKDLSNLAKQRENSNNSGVSDTEIENQRSPQIKYFTVASVGSNNVLTISETTDPDFNLITRGTIWSLENDGSAYNIKPINYRVLNIEEKSLNEYQVTAMMYNETKFNAFERDGNLQKTQESEDLKFTLSNYPTPITLTGQTSVLQAATYKIYDAYFTKEKSENDQELNVSFDATAGCGGYVVEVNIWGRRVRFCLDGSDNTSFSVFLGDSSNIPANSIFYKVYVYDKDFKLEQMNID